MKGLYVHIPFCIKKCKYCDFNSSANFNHRHFDYFTALFKEMKLYRSWEFDTIYIGGGTPSCVATRLIVSLLNYCMEVFAIAHDAEITIECNPGTVTLNELCELREVGINRLSVGVQSSLDRHLRELGRIHTFEDAKNCLQMAKRAGFDNISADLMFGLPQQTNDEWRRTLDDILSLELLTHISCYSLKIEEKTPFYYMNLNLPNDDEVRGMYDICVDTLAQRKFNMYEISNFCLNGYESKHNLKYWRCLDYLGVGVGAHSLLSGVRQSNTDNILNYMNFGNSIDSKQKLSTKEQMSEFIIMGLRLKSGIEEKEFEKRFACSIFTRFEKQIDYLVKTDLLVHKQNRFFLNDNAFYISNVVMKEFI